AWNVERREDPEVVFDPHDPARQALELAADAGGKLAPFLQRRHAHGERIDEQHRHRPGEAAHDLKIEMTAVVIPPVLAADADDADEHFCPYDCRHAACSLPTSHFYAEVA